MRGKDIKKRGFAPLKLPIYYFMDNVLHVVLK